VLILALVSAIAAGWVGLVGWLLLSAPTVEQAGVTARLECRPLGKGGGGSLLVVSDAEWEFVEGYIDERLALEEAPYPRSQRAELKNGAPSEVFRVCSEARTNRMASLVVVVAGGVTLVFVGAVALVVQRLAHMTGNA